MSEDGYNGYANWETWNTVLWLNNDEGLYRSVVLPIQRLPHIPTLREIEDIVKDAMPDGTPDMDDRRHFEGVDWDEVYAAVTEE